MTHTGPSCMLRKQPTGRCERTVMRGPFWQHGGSNRLVAKADCQEPGSPPCPPRKIRMSVSVYLNLVHTLQLEAELFAPEGSTQLGAFGLGRVGSLRLVNQLLPHVCTEAWSPTLCAASTQPCQVHHAHLPARAPAAGPMPVAAAPMLAACPTRTAGTEPTIRCFCKWRAHEAGGRSHQHALP
jgi:hypothetical protein